METQSAVTLAVGVLAIALGIAALPEVKVGRTSFGVSIRDGAIAEFGKGALFSLPFLALAPVVYGAFGLADINTSGSNAGAIVGICIYFLILFIIEEAVFRGALMTGLGVRVGKTAALVVSSVLVASAYAFAPDTGVLPVFGAVLANALHGFYRWQTGRIWWGLGQRWLWNAGIVSLGFANSSFTIDGAFFDIDPTGPEWITGGSFGVEGGVVGISFLVAFAVLGRRFAAGRHGPWWVDGEKSPPRSPGNSKHRSD